MRPKTQLIGSWCSAPEELRERGALLAFPVDARLAGAVREDAGRLAGPFPAPGEAPFDVRVAMIVTVRREARRDHAGAPGARRRATPPCPRRWRARTRPAPDGPAAGCPSRGRTGRTPWRGGKGTGVDLPGAGVVHHRGLDRPGGGDHGADLHPADARHAAVVPAQRSRRGDRLLAAGLTVWTVIKSGSSDRALVVGVPPVTSLVRYVTLGLPRPESSPERDEPARSLDGDAPARTAPRAPEGVRRRQRRATRRRPPPPVALQDAAVGVVRFLDLGEDDAHGFRPSLEDPHRRLRHGRHEPPAPVQGSSREQFDGDVRHNVLQCTFVALHEKIFRYMKQGAVVDVVVLGEPLVEFSADRPLTEAEDFRLSFSGDALNVSVAAAASGAAVALVTRVGRDEL